MSKNAKKMTSQVENIFNDLEDYLNFCRSYGYRYDESELYNNRSFVFRQFTKYQQGKSFKDMWEQNSKSN
jgi:hypothetical protein